MMNKGEKIYQPTKIVFGGVSVVTAALICTQKRLLPGEIEREKLLEDHTMDVV